MLAIGKNLRRIVLLFVVFLSLFGFSNATALEKNIVITDVAIKDKSETITVEEPALSNNDITSNITFNKTGDFATFELSLTNNESEKYKIESISDNNTNENIEIDYSFSEDYIDAGGLSTVTIKLTYKNTLINVDKISIDDLTIKIYLVNEDGEGGEIIINPATSDALPFYLVILAVALAGLVLLFKNKKNKAIKIGGILVALAILFIPLATLAKEKYEVQIKFTDIDIIGEFETYNITINPGNGDEILVVPVQYGNKLESLPANPSKDGYDFDKWADDNDNTVTSDTVITGPITVEAQYTIKHYAINYDLDGGSLPDGKTNPSEYTIEDEVTINNPEKLGYTFVGWSGTGIDGKTTNLVIPAGSKDERSYVSNYSANEDTPYTVTHRYQNLDDLTTYTESTVTEYGETDKTIPAPRQERTGFETPAVQNVKVEADGSAHITYTYDRKQIHLHINNSRFIVEGDVTGYYPYGSTIHLTAIERPGYTFGWNDGVKTYARDYVIYSTTVLAPGYVANTDTPYVVNHYKQKLTLDGYEIADTQNLTGTTDAPISPAVNSYTGFKSPAVQHTTIAGDKSTVVNYYYDREMYEFSFNDNENVTSTKPADSYPYETVITLTANTVDGKTFSKWSNNETDNPLTITLTGDLTIEPEYIDSSLTVTFDTGDGSEVASQTVNYGEKATRPTENPTKKNYLFYDWYTTDSYETVFNFNTEITADTTIYARFVPSSFPTVFEQEGECIFNGSEGVLEGENCAYANGENKYIDTGVQLYIAENHDKDYEIGFTIKSYDYLENERQATFMNTKLEGDNYPGLVFRQFDAEDRLDFSSRRTSSANSRKLWSNQDKERVVRIYRITNKTTKIQEIFYSMDGGEKVRLNDLSQFNPVFDTSVWFGAAPTNTSANVAQRILVGTLSNMYIKLGSYEEPEGLTYTVDLDANGGSVSPASITKDKGDAVGELPTPTNIPAGKEFDGWYTDLGEKGVKVDSSYMPNTGTTLYAKYTDAQKFTVTFNTDGGSSVDSQTVTYGGKATRPSTDPTKEGYIFDDWYTTSGYATVFDFANTAITTNTTIYAKFNVDVCKTFATDSWTTIRDNLASDSNYYAVGCEKEVEIDMDDDSTSESYTVRLANTSTPEVCSTEGYSQTACGVVIEFADIVGEGTMNSTNTNEGGWKASNMATYLNSVFFNKLPSGLQSVIVPTYPIVSGSGKNHSSSNITSEDIAINKVYLLSSREAGLNATNDNKNNETTDTRVLDYYVGTPPDGDDIKRVKKNINGLENHWWLRSAGSNWGDSFHSVIYDDGYHYGHYGWWANMAAYGNTIGISPAFRIGTMPEFTVSFDTDGGSEITSQTITYGEKATSPLFNPAKEGYRFDNWYTTDSYDTIFDFDNTVITGDTTIYAKWEEPSRKATDIIANQANNLGDYIIDFTRKAVVSDDIATANGNGVNTYTERGETIYYYRGQIDDNNVIWANKCWKIIRTTATGGTKMIYNGEPSDVEVDGETVKQCNATGDDTKITYNGSNTFKFNTNTSSPADVGYMYGERYIASNINVRIAGYIFANDVDYDETTGVYTLKDTFTLTDWSTEYLDIAERYHYTCGSTATSCTDVLYLHYITSSYSKAIVLSNVKDIEAAKEKMFTNTNDSIIKTIVESWFEQENLDGHETGSYNYEDDLEDTVFCNDRSYYTGLLKSKDDGSSLGTTPIMSYHSTYIRNTVVNSDNNYEPSLDCANTNDAFTKVDTTNGNAKLKHKVGLITADELTIADPSYNTVSYLHTYKPMWSSSPYAFGSIAGGLSWGGGIRGGDINNSLGLRPLVSLKAGIEFASGTGTTADPYIVEQQ